MGTLLFIVVIVVLIVVHELGHFFVAKWSGMAVDEFGLGYPPRAATLGTYHGTTYTLNWLPFGGFVKIRGENLADDAGGDDPESFTARPRLLQALVLVAGVTMNIVLAYVLFVAVLYMGVTRPLDPTDAGLATHVQLGVIDLLPGSPASAAGLLPGDALVEARDVSGTWQATDADSFTKFVAESGGSDITLSIARGNDALTETVRPVTGLLESDPSRYAIGVSVAQIGTVRESFPSALVSAGRVTKNALLATGSGLAHFFYGVFTLSANWSQVSGPVGIAGAVGTASAEGFGNLLTLVAIISINLALINLIPIPALDGGRLLFVIIEAVLRRPLPARAAGMANAIGFAFLLLLMLAVTAHDIFRLVQ
jgi:regulator of sigma E protease